MEEKGCFIYWGFRERQESLQAVYPPIILYKSLNKSLSLYYYPHFTMRKLSLRMAKWRYHFVWEGSKGEGRLKGHEGLGANLGSFIPLVSTHFVSLSACVPPWTRQQKGAILSKWGGQWSRPSSARKDVVKAFEEESDIRAVLQECCRVEGWLRDRLASCGISGTKR